MGKSTILLLVLLVVSVVPCGAQYEVWVTNERSGDVTIVDGVTHKAVARVAVGKRPRGIHVSPDQKTVYVAVSGTPIGAPPKLDANGNPIFEKKDDDDDNELADKKADGIVILDVATRKITGKLNAGSDPEQFSLSKDGSKIYASNEDVATASILDIGSGKIDQIIRVKPEPEGVGTTPDGKYFYVTCETEGNVFVIDTSSYKRVAELKVNVRPRSVAFLPDSSRAFVPSESTGKIHIIDNRSFRILDTISLPQGSRPMCLAVDSKGMKLYASTGRGGGIAVLNTSDGKLLNTIKVGTRPWGIAISPDGRYLYAANGPSNDISVVDLEKELELKRIRAGESPWGVTVVQK